jgi:broad specificity phosphatase PhoE
MTRASKEEVEARRAQAIKEPYPNGESFEHTSRRMKAFLKDLLKKNYDGKTIMIIGHRATQYGLDEWIKDMSLKDAVLAPWQWQPGWKYELAAEILS